MHIETDVWDIRFANTQNHGHWPLPYLAVGNEFAKFTEAADKTLTQRLLYVSSPAREPVNGGCDAWKRRILLEYDAWKRRLLGFGRLTLKNRKFFTMARWDKKYCALASRRFCLPEVVTKL